MTQFTPGPWIYEKSHQTIWIWDKDKTKIVMHVSNDDGLKREVREANEANARLIAAAPEMYELLSEIFSHEPLPKHLDESIKELFNRINQ